MHAIGTDKVPGYNQAFSVNVEKLGVAWDEATIILVIGFGIG